jgi:hypothetical protein
MTLLNLDTTINTYLEIINKNILEPYVSIPEKQLDFHKTGTALNGYVNTADYSLNTGLLKTSSGTGNADEIFIVEQDTINCKITKILNAVSAGTNDIRFSSANTFKLQLYDNDVCMYLEETTSGGVVTDYYDLSKITTASLTKIDLTSNDKGYAKYFLMYVILKKIKDANYPQSFDTNAALDPNTYNISKTGSINGTIIVATVNIIDLINKNYYDKYELFIDCLYYYYTIILLEYNYTFVTKQLTHFESEFTTKNTAVYNDTETTLKNIFIDLLKIIHADPSNFGLINSRILTESNFITKLLNIYGPASSNSSVNILGYHKTKFEVIYTSGIREMYASLTFDMDTMKNVLLAKTIDYFCNNLSIKNSLTAPTKAQLIMTWTEIIGNSNDISSDGSSLKANNALNTHFGTSVFPNTSIEASHTVVYNFLMSGGSNKDDSETSITHTDIKKIHDNNILKFLLNNSDNFTHISNIINNATVSVNPETDISTNSGLFKIITNAINTIGENNETYFDKDEATSLPKIKNKIFQDIFKIHCKKVSTDVDEKVYDEIEYNSASGGSITISSSNTLPILLLHLDNSVTATPPAGSSEIIFNNYDFTNKKINVSKQKCLGTLKQLDNNKVDDEKIELVNNLYTSMTGQTPGTALSDIYTKVLTSYSITTGDTNIDTTNARGLYTKIALFTKEYDKVYELTNVRKQLLENFKSIKNDLDTEQIDGSQIKIDDIKKELKTADNSYKENVDKYKTKNNELNNILKNNLYNNIFLYITIVVLILICLGLIYINNHKASLKTQYSVMLIAFLLLYYIIYTNVTVNITETFASSPVTTIGESELKGLHEKIHNKLILLSSSEKTYGTALKKEKNKYDGFAKSSNSKLNSLELVLNDEFINAIKSKELVKFLVLFTAICIISYIVYTNTEDPTTTSIIFIILFVIILAIYFYNINLMTRTKADNKYWNHQMVMK